MIGTCDRARISRVSSIPSIPGIARSVITSSGCAFMNCRQRLRAVLRNRHLMPIALQRSAQHPRDLRLIVHNQYPHGPDPSAH